MTVTNVELLKLGLRIRASRKVLGWTQKRFSRNCGLDRSYFGGVERGKRNMTFSVLCQICDSLSCDIATVTKGIPHLLTVGGLASGSRVLDSDSERAEGKFQKPGKMGSKKERDNMNITNQIYMGAEAAMSNALAGVSRPNGVKRLFIVLCAPLLLAVLFYVRHYVF